MATPVAATRIGRDGSEERAALFGVLVAVSAATGGMWTAIEAVHGTVPLAVVPTVALVVALAVRARRASAWSASGVWLTLLPMADGIAALAPLLMIWLCVAMAIGPDRVLDWIRDEWSGREPIAEDVATGWIEDDRSVR